MGSLNDYGKFSIREQPKKRSFTRRILTQSAAAAAFFLLIASSVNADNAMGELSRYVLGTGIRQESSWVDISDPLIQDQHLSQQAMAGTGESGSLVTPTADPGIAPDSDLIPNFTAPASGVVVSELSVASSGFPSQQGMLIEGSAGQKVKAAAAGTVSYLAESEGSYQLEVSHSGDFVSVYQGLSAVDVSAGDFVSQGSVIGSTDSGDLVFSLLCNDVEVDPLEYLFK